MKGKTRAKSQSSIRTEGLTHYRYDHCLFDEDWEMKLNAPGREKLHNGRIPVSMGSTTKLCSGVQFSPVTDRVVGRT